LCEEYERLNAKYKEETLVVFVGDSITKRFNIQEFANTGDILNRGIFSDTTYGLLMRMDRNILNLEIDKLFIMIGYNDLKFRSNAEIIRNIERILTKSKARETYVQSLLPVSADKASVNERIVQLNDALKALSQDSKCFYVDLYSRFKGSDNGIKSELTSDGVHPNYFGYRLWYSTIEPLL